MSRPKDLLRNRAVQRSAAALLLAILAVLVGPGLVGGDNPPAAPAAAPTPLLTVTAGRSSWGDPAPAATPVAGESNLKEPGDVDLGTLRGAPPADSSDTLPGCTSRFNTHNFSARTLPVSEIAVHYTVSPNTPGWGDVLGVAAGLNDPARQASADVIIDAEGHCLYTVPLRYKAWTEVGGNGFSASIEFVATGAEGKLSARALARGGQVIAAIARRYGIKVQLGDVTGCHPNREGVDDHAMYGACGGGHYDMRPFYGSHVPRRPGEDATVLGPLIAAARSHGVTSTDRVTCRKLSWWRSHGRPHGKAEANAVRRRKALTARGVRCLASGPAVAG